MFVPVFDEMFLSIGLAGKKLVDEDILYLNSLYLVLKHNIRELWVPEKLHVVRHWFVVSTCQFSLRWLHFEKEGTAKKIRGQYCHFACTLSISSLEKYCQEIHESWKVHLLIGIHVQFVFANFQKSCLNLKKGLVRKTVVNDLILQLNLFV